MTFGTMTLPRTHDVLPPDGSESGFCYLPQKGMAHFILRTGQVSRAVRHQTVEQIGHIILERGEMWRTDDDHEEISTLAAGTFLTIPPGTTFQFRS
jgi:mannose-6-phosphate isomerase-like protein (cupin superfamily)